MLKKKLLISLLLTGVILLSLTGTVLAAPKTDGGTATATPPAATTTPAPIVGTVQAITIQTDANAVTTVQVVLLDQNNVQQTVTLTVSEAVSLGLVTLDANNVPIVDQSKVGQSVTVQPPAPAPAPDTETAQNPVSALVASFFGLDYSTVEGFHKDGSGYGVIAQACWMSYELKGDASLCADIIQAKNTGDYSGIVLPDGTKPSNWGQFKKAADDNKGPMETLGAIVSGRAKPITKAGPPTTSTPQSVNPTPQTVNPTPQTVDSTPPPADDSQSNTANGNNGNGNDPANNNGGNGNGNDQANNNGGNGNSNSKGNHNGGNGNGNSQGNHNGGNGNGNDNGQNNDGNGNGNGNGNGPGK